MTFFSTCLDLLYPPRCGGCARDLRRGGELCPSCRRELEISRSLDPPCPPDEIDGLITLGPYAGLLRRLIMALKFAKRRWLLPSLVTEIVRLAPTYDVAAIVAVPPSPGSPLEEHLAFELASSLSRQWSVPFYRHCIEKTRATPPQRHLPRMQRRRNLEGAFRVVPQAKLFDRSILLIDDVLTTGSTIKAVSSALRKELSPSKLHGLVLSHAALRSVAHGNS